ncbi:hypothetical protein HGRIS_007356 [Hohenbuehelia grisea]|uniref:Uncharacterized protein n=1 Tax=Hohenbuehelia grisea TaxID=104357 RepID=A0ABR3J4H6_9AGAR
MFASDELSQLSRTLFTSIEKVASSTIDRVGHARGAAQAQDDPFRYEGRGFDNRQARLARPIAQAHEDILGHEDEGVYSLRQGMAFKGIAEA